MFLAQERLHFCARRLLVVEVSQLYGQKSTREAVVFNLITVYSKGHYTTPSTVLDAVGKMIRHDIDGCGTRLLFVDVRWGVCSVNASQDNLRHYVRHFPIR